MRSQHSLRALSLINPSHVIGMIVCLERYLTDAEERGNAFFLNLLEKQHTRLKGLFERRVVGSLRYHCGFTHLILLLTGRAYQISRRHEANE